jgi:hypothetical protein
MADLPAGAKAKLDSVEVGGRSLELRCADGQVEQHTATVEAESTANVPFTNSKAPLAQGEQPPVAVAGQTSPSTPAPAKVAPKEELQDEDALPKARSRLMASSMIGRTFFQRSRPE